jgi:hypothetical protein
MSKHPSPAADETPRSQSALRAASAKREAKELAFNNPFAVFIEWTDEADEKAYADL